MSITARFHCHSVRNVRMPPGSTPAAECELFAVTGAENEPWSRYTPSGQLKITITNPAAIGAITPGTVYELVLTEVADA